jgi:tetratricopeptide (TPR) repeat protein
MVVYNVSTGIQGGGYSAYICCTMRQALLFMLFCGLLPVSAQQRYTDSLYKVVHDNSTDNTTRILALSHLSRTVRYYDEPRALQQAEEAVQLSRKEAASSKVYAYAGRSLVYLKMRDYNRAHTDMDSCLLYAAETNDVKARSWAFYQKGRQLAYEEKTKEALPIQLQALQLIKGKGYWEEEAGIYYALYGVFSTWEDLDNEDKYATLALDAAQKSKEPNRLCEAWQAMATATEYRYKQTKNKTLLDSTVQSLRNAITIYRQNEGYMQMMQLITIPCVNMANAYNIYFPASSQVTDSIRHYAMMAFNYASKDRDTRLQAAAFGLMQEDAKRNGDYELAETYLQQALSLLLSSRDPDKYLLSSAQNELAGIAELRKDLP